jgi:hypothetical protein
MKKISLLLFSMLISSFIFSQKLAATDVPAQAFADLKARFPNAEKADWVKKDNVMITVNFINDGNKMEIDYQNNVPILTKWGINKEYLPQKIKDYVTKYYAAYKISEMYFVDKSSGERVNEVIITLKKKEKKTLVFDTSNNFLRLDEPIKPAN